MPKRLTRSKKASSPFFDYELFRLIKQKPLARSNDSEMPEDSLWHVGNTMEFSVQTLCAAIQENCKIDAIKTYLQKYQYQDDFQNVLAGEAWPSLYYAVEKNSAEMINVLIQLGVDPQIHQTDFFIPLLAYAIVSGYREAVDTSDVVKALLASGSDPAVIPMDMWYKYLEAPGNSPNTSIKVPKDSEKKSSWCTSNIRPLLARSLHLTHRYVLKQAYELKNPNNRVRQIVHTHNISGLLKIPYFLVGQRPASNIIMMQVFAHVALRAQTPLVMAFAGPSGHGKTEMARSIGSLISVDTVVIDCTSCQDVWALLGSTAGWDRNQDGSKLNNHLAENTGRRSVVFLDEFDKCNQQIRNALLLATESGRYTDRRNEKFVDCSKTIWIIATNFGDDLIKSYYTRNLERLDDNKRNNVDLKALQASLKIEYKNKFGAPFAGRINVVVPFLPFSPSECAVVLHKFILNLATDVRQPIDIRPEIRRFVGHCRLRLVNDGKVCMQLVEDYYNADLGARSLANAVKQVGMKFFTEYITPNQLVTEDINKGPLQAFVVRCIAIRDNVFEIGVYPDTEQMSQDKASILADTFQRSLNLEENPPWESE